CRPPELRRTGGVDREEAMVCRLLAAAAHFAAVALLVGIGASGATAQELEKITFLTPAPSSLPSFAAAQIAKGKGYFKAEGLEVEIMTGKGGADVAKQIGAGNADAGYVVGDAPI